MDPIGYIVMQFSVRQSRPAQAYDKWIARIPAVYREYVLNQPVADPPGVANDPCCFAMLKNYRSLMPLAQEARKPMFYLKPADGALGAHTYAVQDAYGDFEKLAGKIAQHCQIEFPASHHSV